MSFELAILSRRSPSTSRLWEENWRLNPRIKDPDLLRIGRRIRIITERPPEPRDAQVTLVSRIVKTKKYPTQTEEDAQVGDLLKERDGVRTAQNSSAELTFDEESRLQIGELSLVFLVRMDSTLRGIKRESIEIIEGEAEVSATPATVVSREIEILVGNARARPSVDETGSLRIRSRRVAGSSAAQIMVYGGKSDVEAGGTNVSVPRGMGTSVPEEGPPSPPEKLLPAPRLETKPGRRWNFSNPLFRWQEVTDASSYTVEICQDAGCSALFRRSVGLTESPWSPAPFPVGSLFWRVTAVSASGLDGYPSQTRAFHIDSERADWEPPVVVITRQGAGRQGAGGSVILGVGGSLHLRAIDDASGVASVLYRWDSGPWTEWDGQGLTLPKNAEGETLLLEVQAKDLRGRVSKTWPATVGFQPQGPEPPKVDWPGTKGPGAT